jgi:hypothetical protein
MIGKRFLLFGAALSVYAQQRSPDQLIFRQLISNKPTTYPNQNSLWIYSGEGDFATTTYVNDFCYRNGTGTGCYLQGAQTITIDIYSEAFLLCIAWLC